MHFVIANHEFCDVLSFCSDVGYLETHIDEQEKR